MISKTKIASLFIIIILMLFLGIYIYLNQNKNKIPNTQNQQEQTDWKVYKEEKYGISLLYPPTLNLIKNEYNDYPIIFSLDNTQNMFQGALTISEESYKNFDEIKQLFKDQKNQYEQFTMSEPEYTKVDGIEALKFDAVLKPVFTGLDSDVYSTALYIKLPEKILSIRFDIDSKDKQKSKVFLSNMNNLLKTIKFTR